MSETAIKTLEISQLKRKIFSMVSVEPRNLIEICRQYSIRFGNDWQKILNYFDESMESSAPKNSILYIQSVLVSLEEEGLTMRTGDNNFFVLWQLGEKAFKDDEEVTVSVPKSTVRQYRLMAERLGTTIDEAMKIGLRFYLTQRPYQKLSHVDLLKVLIVDSFGSASFKKEDLTPLLKSSGIFPLIDFTLESYCLSENVEDKDNRFLVKENGSYRINEKVSSL